MGELTFARDSEIVILLGRRRMGKTHNMRAMLLWSGERYPQRRHLVWDRIGQFAYWKRRGSRILHAEGSLPANQTIIYKTPSQFARYREFFWSHRYHVVQGNQIPVDLFFAKAMESGGVNLWIDEIDKISTKHKMPHGLEELVQRGAHFGSEEYGNEPGVDASIVGWGGVGASLVCAVRRIQEVHNSIVAGATVVCSVYSDLPADNKKLAEVVHQNYEQLDARLRGLRKPHMLRWDDGYEVSGRPDIWLLPELSDPKEGGPTNGRKEDECGDEGADGCGLGPGRPVDLRSGVVRSDAVFLEDAGDDRPEHGV